MSLLENITLQMSLDDRKFEREFKAATQVANKQMDALTLGAAAFEEKWEDITSNLRSVKRVASGLAISAAIYGITDAITGASSAILNFRNNLEASKISMEYFAQSSNQAYEYIRELEDFAAYTPFSTENAVAMAQYLQAMSVPINASKSVLTVISDTAAATGATEENMQRIVTALGQILTKGKLAAEEVRQLANANIPIYDILKEQLDLTGQQIKNLGTLNINASKAVVAILDGLKERYEGASAKIADTLGGMTETIKDDALIISESFFHGTLNGIEDKIRGIRDQLDKWREISMHAGTGGMIEAIINDLGKTEEGRKELEQFIIAAIAGFKNLGATIQEFTTHNGNLLKTFAKVAYTGIMSLTIALDYLLRGFNLLQTGGEKVVDVINKITGMSLTLSDVVAGLMVFNTVGKTLMFAGNTAFWAGKQFVSLGTTLTSVIPVISSASAPVRGLTAGLITLGAAAATAYFGLKAIRGATGVTSDSTLVTDDYKKQMEDMDDKLKEWEESLNQDYSTIADSWSASMSDALDDTEKKSKKTAKKVAKTWLMSFDEVFQIREDPEDPLAGELKKFEDIDWGQFFELPEFRFPKSFEDAITDPMNDLGATIDTAQEQVGILNGLLPLLIATGAGILTNFNNRRQWRKNNPMGPAPTDEELSAKELKAKIDEDFAEIKRQDDLLDALAKKYDAALKEDQKVAKSINAANEKLAAIESELHDAYVKSISTNTPENKQIIERLEASLAAEKEELASLNSIKRNTETLAMTAQRMELLRKSESNRVDAAIKRLTLAGDDRIIPTPGKDAAQRALAAEKINKNIIAIRTQLDELQPKIAERNKAVRELAKGENTDALVAKIGQLDSAINNQTDYLDRGLKGISRLATNYIGQYGNVDGIDITTLDGIIHNNFRALNQHVDTLTRIISTSAIDDLPLRLGDFSITLDALNKKFSSITEIADNLNIELSPATRQMLDEKLTALTDGFKPVYKKYADIYNELQLYTNARNKLTSTNDISNHTNNVVTSLQESLAGKRADMYAAQDVIKVLDTNASEVVGRLNAIESLQKTLVDVPERLNKQRVNAVYSIATEVQGLLSNSAVYSTNNSVWHDWVRIKVDELTKAIKGLPNAAETKAASTELLAAVRGSLGMLDSGEAAPLFTDLSGAIETYEKATIAALKNTATTTKAAIDVQTRALNTNNFLTSSQSKQLEKMSEKIAESTAAVDKLSLSSRAYQQESVIYRGFDNIKQSLHDLASASTGNVRQLYTDLASAFSPNKTAAAIRESVTSILNMPGSRTALGVGNTSDTLQQLWKDSHIMAIAELAENMPTLTPTTKASTSDMPIKLLDDIFESAFESVEVKIEEFHADLKTRGLDAWQAGQLISYVEILEDIHDETEAAPGKIAEALTNKFDLAGLGVGEQVPDAYMEKFQHIDTPDDLNRLISEIKEIEKKSDKITAEISKIHGEQKAQIEAIKANKYVDNGIQYYENNALNALNEYRAALINELSGFSKELAEKHDFENDPIRWLRREYEPKSYIPGGFEKATGTLKDISLLGERGQQHLFAGLYGGKDNIIRNGVLPAYYGTRLGAYPGSMTMQGTTAQAALASLFGDSLSDEIGKSAQSSIAVGYANAWNTRMKAVLEKQLGNFAIGGTGVDAKGIHTLKVAGLTELESGLHGIVLRVAEAEGSAVKLTSAIQSLDRQADEVVNVMKGAIPAVNFADFEKALRSVAPDLVNKIASGLLAAPKLKGIVFSVLNTAADIFEPIRQHAALLGNYAQTLDPKELEKKAQYRLADAIRTYNLDDSRYASAMQTIIIKPDSELRAFGKRLENNVHLLRMAAEAENLARAYNVPIDLTPTTVNGTSADAAARYLKLDDAIRKLSSAADIFDTAATKLLEEADVSALKALEEQVADLGLKLTIFDRYISDVTAQQLSIGNTRGLLKELDKFQTQIFKRVLKSGDNLFVGAEQFKFFITDTTADAELLDIAFDAASKKVQEAAQLARDSVPRMLVTYNDMASKIIRAVDAVIIKDGELLTASNGLYDVLKELTPEFNILIGTAQKLETAFGLATDEMSKKWMALRDSGDLNVLSEIDPFKYLGLEESVGKMFSDLEESTGLTTSELFTRIGTGAATPDDITEYVKLLNNYRDMFAKANEQYKTSNNSSIKQIPYLGEASNESVNELLEEIAKGNSSIFDTGATGTASDKVAGGAADDIIDAIAKGISEGSDEGVQKLLPMLIDDALSGSVDDVTESFGARLINSIKKLFNKVGETTKAAASDIGNTFTKVLFGTGNAASSADATAHVATGVTGYRYYDAVIDEDTVVDILKQSATKEQYDAYEEFLRKVAEKAGTPGSMSFNDFIQGAGFEDMSGSKTNKAIREIAKEAFGDDFEAFDELLKQINPADTTTLKDALKSFGSSQLSGLQRIITGQGLAGKAFSGMVSEVPGLPGTSGLDVAFAIKQTLDAMSSGIDEYNRATESLKAVTGYDLALLNSKGQQNTTGNLVNWGDAATSGGQYLAVNGALTALLSNALSSAITSAAGGSLAGPGGTLVGLLSSLVVSAVTGVGMYATGGFNMSNIASEEWKEMLNNHDWAYKQAKEQGASDDEAREVQFRAERDIYTKYYDNMSSIWSAFDKARIRELASVKGPWYAGTHKNDNEGDKAAIAYAVNEALGYSTPGMYAKNGYLWQDKGQYDAKVGYQYDVDKVMSQLYALYTTGGIEDIENYNDKAWYKKLFHLGNKGTGLSELEYDWAQRIKEMDDLTKARLDDSFSLVLKASEYIDEKGHKYVDQLLKSYGIIAEDQATMIEGVVWLYETAMNNERTLMAAKAEYINSGTVNEVTGKSIAEGKGTANRLLEGDLSMLSQEHLKTLSTATGVYIDTLSDGLYTMSIDLEKVKEKMSGFTVTFPDTIKVGSETIKVSDIRADTNAISILKGMGINISADGTVAVVTEAANANKSGHDRTFEFDYADISKYELNALKNAGISMKSQGANDTSIKLDETTLAKAVKGLTYNLSGVDLTSVSAAAVEALKAKGIILAQDQETGNTTATITDTGYITGARDIAQLLAGIDSSVRDRMSTNLTGALTGIDAINAFGAKHGESRIASAAGIEVDTGLVGADYSAALEQAFKNAGITLQAAIDAEGNERVYAAINNVGEQWHKAITQWKTSEITPELKAFLDQLGAEVYTSGEYTMVSTEDILEKIGTKNKLGLQSILFDNAKAWDSFPDEVKTGLIEAGLATEDGFITLSGEALSGWTKFTSVNGDGIKKAYEALDKQTKELYNNLKGTTITSWDGLNNTQLYWLKKLGIDTETEYNKSADELLAVSTNKLGLLKNGTMLKWEELSNSQLIALNQLGIDSKNEYDENSTILMSLMTSKMGLMKDGNLLAWQALSDSQIAQLTQLGIDTEEKYNANAAALKAAHDVDFSILREATILEWDKLSDTTRTKLNAMGIKTKEDYDAYLSSMNVKTGDGMSTIDATTREKLNEIGITTDAGWLAVKEVTDKDLDATEKAALGYMKFEDLPDTIKQALMEGYGDNAWQALHDSWWAINTDAEAGQKTFAETVDGMKLKVAEAEEQAKKLRAILDSDQSQAALHQANLLDMRDTAIEAAKSADKKWAMDGTNAFRYSNGGWHTTTSGGVFGIGAKERKWYSLGDQVTVGKMSVAINSNVLADDGSPAVYYIYDLNLGGGDVGQMIYRVDTGVWQQYEGGRPHNNTNDLPHFKTGGIVTGDGYFRAGEFGLNEAIVPLEQPQAMRKIGQALAAATPAWELVAPLTSMLGRRDGGVAQFSSFRNTQPESSVEEIVSRVLSAQAHRAPQPSYMGGYDDDRRPLYVGTLIADNASLRELDRRMKRVARQDGGR